MFSIVFIMVSIQEIYNDLEKKSTNIQGMSQIKSIPSIRALASLEVNIVQTWILIVGLWFSTHLGPGPSLEKAHQVN